MATVEFAPQFGKVETLDQQSSFVERVKQVARFVFCQVQTEPQPYNSDHYDKETYYAKPVSPVSVE